MTRLKTRLLYWPFLLLRFLILFILFAVIIFLITFFILTNSSMVTEKLFSYVAPQYSLTYQEIEGNLYTGITLEDVRFKNKPMAKEITLKYNPNALLLKELQITKLQIRDADIDVIKYFIASFGTESETTGEVYAKKESPDIDLTIKAENVSLSTRPFKEGNIEVKQALIEAESLTFELQSYQMEAEGFHTDIESNLGKITIEGNLGKRVLLIDRLSILNLDTQGIRKMLMQESDSAQNSQNKQDLALPFDMLKIAEMKVAINATTYEDIRVDQLVLKVANLYADVKTPKVIEGKVMLHASSDIADIKYQGRAEDNLLRGKLQLLPKSLLYQRYKIPLRPGALKVLSADINASDEAVDADIAMKAKALLDAKAGAFNLDINDLYSHLRYEIKTGVLKADSHALVSTPYAKRIRLSNFLLMDQNISYRGEVKIADFAGIDQNLSALLGGLQVDYKGTTDSIETRLESRYFKGRFLSEDMQKGELHLFNSKPLKLASFLSLPEGLQHSEIEKITIDAPIDLKDPMQTEAVIHLDSNVAILDIKSRYAETSKVNAVVKIPENSLLRTFQPKVKWDGLTPLKIDAALTSQEAVLKMNAKLLDGRVAYGLREEKIDARVALGGLKLTAKGMPKERITISTKVSDVKKFGNIINSLYRMDEPLPPIEGSLSLDATIEQMKKLSLTLASPKLIYRPKRGKKQRIEDIALTLAMNDSALEISSYRATYNKQKFFATKSSRISLEGSKVSVPEFWINDTLKINGKYDLKLAKGEFGAKADRFHIKESIADIYTKIDIQTILKGQETTVKGKIILLEGTVTPEVQSKSFATDSDIVIVQELKKKNENSFMEHLTVMLKLESEKPIIFKQPDTFVKLKPDLTILKDPGGKLLYLGSVELLEGGYYRFEDKKFILKKSYVYFTGDVNKPLLDIKATYESLKYLITITVTGTPAAPNINFSSSPSLTREQILSVILFDSEEGGDTHTGDEMMRMMGGAMAKAALSDIGVKVDHLVFGENGSIEVGKKLTNKITVIYINGDVPEIKLKYKHGKHTESVIGVSQKSESYDIIYKGDF